MTLIMAIAKHNSERNYLAYLKRTIAHNTKAIARQEKIVAELAQTIETMRAAE